MSPYYDDLPRRPGPRRLSPWAILTPILLVAGAVLLTLWGLGAFRHRTADYDPNAGPRAAAPTPEPDAIERERIELFKDVKDCVVNVDTLVLQGDGFGLVERAYGTGSGFIWDKEGHIVTNFHVVRSAVQAARDMEVRVILADQSKWNARVIGVSPENDLAVLKIDAPQDKLKPITPGTSHDLEVGRTCYAIGNPFGQSLSLTHGIVSALDREIQSEVTDRPITGAIQTDAALNPGNSGGPLLDRGRRLIGVNTAIATPSGGNVGIGFAIPVETVQKVVPQLIRHQRPAKPILGVVLLSDDYMRRLGYKTGVMVTEVRPNGPAAQAGLRGVRTNRDGDTEPGDIILKVDNTPINSRSDLGKVMAKHSVGDQVKLTIQRGDDVLEKTVTLGGV